MPQISENSWVIMLSFTASLGFLVLILVFYFASMKKVFHLNSTKMFFSAL